MSFSESAHQKQAVEMLRRSLRQGRFAHAYLFIGPRGSGKELLARTLAKALNCEGAREPRKSAQTRTALVFPDDSCDSCTACRKTDANAHPDVYWLRPESKSRQITVDKIRELENSIRLKPREGRMKVGIIVDADQMVAQAANAFLKTLEEPPANSALLLLTTNPQKLLPTVVSRCLPIRLTPIASVAPSPVQTRVLQLLASHIPAAAPTRSPVVNSYLMLAQLTALLQQLRQEKQQEVQAAWNKSNWDSYDRHVRENLEDELEAAVEAEYLSARQEVLATLLAWHRDVLACVVGAQSELLVFPQHAEVLKLHATLLGYTRAVANVETVERIRQHLEQNINESLALEVGLLRMNFERLAPQR